MATETMNGSEITVAIKASVAGLIDGLRQATGSVQNAATQMQGSLNGIQGAIGKVGLAVGAITAILGGGKMFKDAVKETVSWTGEANRLARTLNITTESASVLNMALGDIYTDSDTYIRATTMLTRQLNAGGEAFERMGIKTRDTHGNLRPMPDLMQDTISALASMKAGTDRNAAGVAMFGRQWAEAQKLLRLTPEVMEEARQKAEKLHLLVGPEGAAQVKAYKAAMNDVEDTLTALKVNVGNALMPALVKLGQWFGDIGPGLATVLKASINGLVTAFYTLKFVIEYAVTYATDLFEKGLTGFKTLGAVMTQFMAGNYTEAMNTAKAGLLEYQRINEETTGIVHDLWDKYGKDLAEIWDGVEGKKAAQPDDDGKAWNPDDNDKKDKAAEKWLRSQHNALEEMKGEQANWFTWSVSRELAYWEDKLAVARAKGKDYANAAGAIQKEVNKLRKELAKEEHEAVIEGLKQEMDAAKAEGRDYTALQEAIIREELRLHQSGAKEVIAAERERDQMLRDQATERRRLKMEEAQFMRDVSLQEIADMEAAAAQDLELGRITAQEKAQIAIQAEQRRWEIIQAGYEAELALKTKGSEEEQKLLDQQFLARLQHEQRLRELQHQTAVVGRNGIAEMFAPLKQSMEQTLAGLLAKTTSWRDAMRNIWRSLGQVLDQVVIKMVMSWITGEKNMTLATLQNLWARLTGHQAAEATATTTTAAGAMTRTTASAAEAGAGAAASASKIPYIGWILAIAAMGTVFAAVMGMRSNIKSAAGGWGTVPNDTIAQIHKDEMVLPATYARGLRSMLENGQTGGQQVQAGDTIHVNVQAMDARSFDSFLSRNEGTLVKAFQRANANRRGR